MERHPQELTYPVKGEWLTFRELSAKYGISVATLKYRHYHRGLEGDALVAPPKNVGKIEYQGKLYTKAALAKKFGLSEFTIKNRWSAGIRGEALVSTAYRDACRETARVLDEAQAKSNLPRDTLRTRYLNGLRGDDLIAPIMNRSDIGRLGMQVRWENAGKPRNRKSKNELH